MIHVVCFWHAPITLPEIPVIPRLIEKVARASSGIVLVDEAYHAFLR